MTVAVVHTSTSECRCHSAILEALGGAGIEAREIDADSLPHGTAALKGCRFAFDQTDTYRGDGQRYLVSEALIGAGLTIIGSPPEVGRRLDDKLQARTALQQLGLPVAPLPSGWPRIIKAPRVHGSRGVRLVAHPEEERQARLELGEPLVIEEYVAGREVAVGILGRRNPTLLPGVEIQIRGLIYSQEEKWTLFPPPFLPVDLPEDVPERLAAAYRTLGLHDMARFDLRLRPDGSWVILEVNVRPSLEPIGVLAKAASLKGITTSQMFLGLLAGAGGPGVCPWE